MQSVLARALEQSRCGVVLLDAHGVVLACHGTSSAVWGRTPDETISTAIWELGPTIDRTAWGDLAERADRDGLAEIETLGPQPSGAYTPIRVRVEAVDLPGCERARYLLQEQPLPPRRAEDAADHELWFRCITHYGEDGFWVWRVGAETMAINARWYAMVGRTPRLSESTEHVIEQLHPDDVDPITHAYTQLVDGELHNLSRRVRVRHADGSYRWFRHRAYIVGRDSEGRPTWLVGHDVDITAEVEAKARALARERELNALIERIATAVFVFGPDGRPRRWNRAASTLVGSQRDVSSAIGHRQRTGWDVLDESGAPIPRAELPLDTAIRTREPVWNRVVGVAHGSRRQWGLISAVPSLDDAGNLVDIVCTVTDITETRRLEAELAQRHRLESLGRLAGGVAHDFNNLLTVISSGADLLAGDLPPDAVAQHDVAEIRAAAGRGATITRQLLGYARQQYRRPRTLRLRRYVERYEGLIRRLLPARAEMQVAIPDGLWPVHIDPTQVEQLLMNLTANAGEALEQGDGMVAIELRNDEIDPLPGAAQDVDRAEPGQYVVLAVRDDGRGMAPDVARQALEPFFTTAPFGTRSGLGLSTCLGIARQNGGRLEIRSEVGVGTTVEVWLPKAAGPVDRATSSGPVPAGRPSATILLVEDEAAVRVAIERVLRRAGWTVHAVADGDTALALVEGGLRPDVVLSDVVVPGVDGPTLVALLRRRWPDLPALFMTGYDDDVLRASGMDSTTVEVLRKPFDASRLMRRLTALLSAAVGDGAPST